MTIVGDRSKPGRLVLACSGALGFGVLEKLHEESRVSAVLTDSKSADIIRLCEQGGIPHFKGNPRNGAADVLLAEVDCRFLMSANYLFILENSVLERFAIALNVHGSLLPKYRGRTPHVWAIINNEKYCGITVHKMVGALDSGGILFQTELPILENDTGGTILERYRHLYPTIVDEAIRRVDNNDLRYAPQDESKATYFGARTPADGQIKWSWQRERVRNWIRAQSRPYPGAFTYLHDRKMTIHWAEIDDLGFCFSDANGQVLQVGSGFFTVKTPNGCLRITDWECSEPAGIGRGETLDEKDADRC